MRPRPPNLSLPTVDLATLDNDDDDFNLDLSSPESSPSDSPVIPSLSFDDEDSEDKDVDDISKDLAVLDQLRKSVQKNLRLRPIRSLSPLPSNRAATTTATGSTTPSFFPPASAWLDHDREPGYDSSASITSPGSASSTASSSYFTPLSETGTDSPPRSAHFLGPTPISHSTSVSLTPQPWVERRHSDLPVVEEPRRDQPTTPPPPPPSSPPLSKIKKGLGVKKKSGGALFQLAINTQATYQSRTKVLPEIEFDSPPPVSATTTERLALPLVLPASEDPHSPFLKGRHSPRSPMPTMSTFMTGPASEINIAIVDPSPSPPPSHLTFRRPPPPARRPSVPALRRLDTKSAQSLRSDPKASEKLGVRSKSMERPHIRTKPIKSATLTLSVTVPPPPLRSPSHLILTHSNHNSPPGSAQWSTTSFPSSNTTNTHTAYYTPPLTPGLNPGTPKAQQFDFSSPSSPSSLPPSPSTARPSPSSTFDNIIYAQSHSADSPSTTSPEANPPFTISTILPNFLYLGPELTSQEHLRELQEIGVKRILNLAIECDANDHGLQLADVFDKYAKIPMRDTVEEDRIAWAVREVCDILDDARLHSAPTYVHCKAGKSRSVTAVIAYLIHANHWTLSRAYAFVLERRKGISPNIGFVSELMTFEEEELGGKSIGVVGSSAPPGTEHDVHHGGGPNYGHGHGMGIGAGGNRRGGHVRESLPPVFVTDPNMSLESSMIGGPPMSANEMGGMGMSMANNRVGDSGQEMEVKDSSGRYRHARPLPVDSNTLQPMRRVSKAGLESSAYA